MWITRITPYLFCNSIQESNNNVFESRSCTHVLIQEKVYASKLNTKLSLINKIKSLMGLFDGSTMKQKEGEKTPRCVCTSYEKTMHLGFVYILFNTWSSRHKGGGKPSLADWFRCPQRDSGTFPCFQIFISITFLIFVNRSLVIYH